MDLAGLTSCRDITAEHADEAVRSLENLRALLARLTEIAEPEDGAPKVLIIFARLAKGDVAWLEGDVTAEITGNDDRTLIDLYKEEGWGIKERLSIQLRFRVPFDEFERAVEISAKRFAPLKADLRQGKIILSSSADASSASSMQPPALQVDEKSVGTAPPPPLGVPQEPEPFELPPASEPDPFDAEPVPADIDEPGFGAFADAPELDDPVLAAAIVSPKKKESQATPAAPKASPMPDPAAAAKAPAAAKPAGKPADPVHSRPTVRRMVAIKPEALRTGRKDPRREEDD